MVVAILVVYFCDRHLRHRRSCRATIIPPTVQTWAFLAFALAFAVKMPLFPFHTWLPDAHVQAPTAGSIILAGVLLKMGTYGYLRLAMPIFPDAATQFGPIARHAGRHRHPLRRAGGAGAEGYQVAGRLQFGGPSGLRHARHLRHERAGHQRRRAADGQPRPEHGRALPHGRPALRTAPHAHARRLRRPVEERPDLLPVSSWSWP